MSDIEVARVREWNKVQLVTVSLLCLAVLGAVREYIHISQPSDRAVLVYHFGDKAPEQATEIKIPEQQPQAEQASVDEHPNALPELLDYMHEMEEKAATITFEETVLDKIHQSEKVAEPEPKPEPVVQENKAEAPKPVEVIEKKVEVIRTNNAAEIEKAKTDVLAKVLDNVDKIAADSEAMLSEEQVQQNADNAAIAEYISLEQQANEEALEHITQEIGTIETEDEDAPIVLLPGVLDKQ